MTVVDAEGAEHRAELDGQLVLESAGGDLADVPLPDGLRDMLPDGLAVSRVEYRTLAARDRIEVSTVIWAAPAGRADLSVAS